MKILVATNHRLDASKRLGSGYTQPDHKTIDWNNSSDRKWLMTHMHWAMHNARIVSIIPES